MSREVRRVPMDFVAPMNKVWIGYVNPHYAHCRECPFCSGTGLNEATKAISDDFYDFNNTGRRWVDKITQDEADALVAHNRGREWRGRENGGWVSVPRTAAEFNAANARGSSPLGDLSHDDLNRWILIETRATRLGVYGHCEHCDDGSIWRTPADREAYDAWTPTEPPTGDGWQMWETTSEGSPMSPVFATPEDLARWLADTGASAFGYTGASYEHWLGMIRAGSTVGSVIAVDGRLMSGVEAATVKP